MIKPEGIPIAELTKVIQTIDAHDQALRDIGPKFTLLGQDVNRSFKSLAPHYEAPERDVLIGSTQIIETKLGEFGPTLPTMAGHLRNLAGATQEKLTELTNIRTEAYSWYRRKDGNPEWQNDQDMIDDNNRMVQRVTKIMQEELPAICFNAANAIAQLYGGKPWDPKTGVREGDQPPPPPDEDKEQEPPAWGTEEERDKPWWQDCLEFPVNAVVGVLTVVGETVQSILTLIPVLPALGSIGPLRRFMKSTLGWDMPTWQQAGDSWKGLGMMVAQVVTAPYQLAWAAFDSATGLDTRPDAVKEFGKQGLAMGKEMVKGFVAWDEWSKNPGKAFGMALTNVVATVASGGSAGAVKTAAMAGKFGAASMTVAKVAGVAEKLQVTRGALHDAALGAVTKIPKVADVVNGMSKIPIVGETFKMQNLTKVDVPKIDAPNAHAPIDAPHGSVDTSSAHTTSVDTPSVHTPSVESPSVHTPNVDAPSAHTGAADPTPVSHAGTNTPTAHNNPSTPASHTAPGTPTSHTDPGTPTSHTDPGTPTSHTDPGTAASSPHTPATTHTPAATPNTPTAPHAPDSSTHTPAATHAPDPATHTPAAAHTPDPGTHTPSGTHTPDPATHTPAATHTPDPATHAPAATHTPDPATHTPAATHTPDATAHTPAATHTPDPATRTPAGTHTPESLTHSPQPTSHSPSPTHTPDPVTHSPSPTHTPDPVTHSPSPTHTPDPVATPTPSTTPSTAYSPSATHTPDPATHSPSATHAPGTTRAPDGTPSTPSTAHTPDPVAAPVAPIHPGVPGPGRAPDAPHSSSPRQPHQPNDPNALHQPSDPNAPQHEANGARERGQAGQADGTRRSAHDDGNDPTYDDPAARQAEIDRMQPEYLRSDPGRTQVDPNNFIRRDPIDPRGHTLERAVGDPPEGNLKEWAGSVNPDYGRGPHYAMNCADCSRKTASILNGEKPALANGRRLADGESETPTLEWMDLKDFAPENKLRIHDSNLNPGDFTETAYRRVYDALDGRPPGTHANIFVRWHSGHPNIPGAGHVLNAVVDEHGVVRILDTQPNGGLVHDAFPKGKHEGFDNPYKSRDPQSNLHDTHITELQFAVRERGGHWEGVPRDPHAPKTYVQHDPHPTSNTPHGSEAHTPDAQTPEAHTPDAHTPEAHAPGARTPEARAPESPEYGTQRGGGEDPFAGSELADPGFRASAADHRALRAEGGMHSGKLAEVRQRLQQQSGNTVELSDTEVTSLERMLIGHDHQDVNDGFRAGDRTVEQKPVVRVAASTLKKLPDFEGEIHRGLSFDSADDLEKFLNRYRPGQTAHEPAFTHSAKGQNGADDFSGGRYSAGRVVLHIDAKHGKDLSFMRDPAVGIDEVMHGPHTPFYPTKIEPDADGVWHVHVRDHGGPVELPPGTHPEPIVVERPQTDNYWSQQARQPSTPPAPNTPAQPHTPPHQQPQPQYGPGQHQQPQQPQYGPGRPQHQQPQYGPGQPHQQPQPQYGPGQPQRQQQTYVPGQHHQPQYGPGQPHQQPQQPYAPGQPHQQPQYGPGQPHQQPQYGPGQPHQQPQQPYGPGRPQHPGQFGPTGHDPRQPQQPAYDPRQQPPGYDPRELQQPGYDPRQQPGGYDPRQQPGGYDPRRPQEYPNQPGYDPQGGFGPTGHRPDQPGFEPSGQHQQPGHEPGRQGYPNQPGPQQHPGQQPAHDPRQQPGGYNPRQQPGGYDPRQQPGGYDPRQQPGGYDPHQQPGYDPRQEPGGYDARGAQRYSDESGGFGPVGHDSGQPGFGPTGHDPREGQQPGYDPRQYPPQQYSWHDAGPYQQPPQYNPQHTPQYNPQHNNPQHNPQYSDPQHNRQYNNPQYNNPQYSNPHQSPQYDNRMQEPPAYGGPPQGPPAFGGPPQGPPTFGGQPHDAASSEWRAGDAGFGVSGKDGFDPAFHHKALGDEWAPGVHDPDGKFFEKERATADRLEEEGWRVDARPQDDSKDHMKNPESMVRKSPADEGLITEFKRLDSASESAIKRNVKKAAAQVPHANGEAVIDGRKVGLTEEAVDKAYASLVRLGDRVPAKLYVILGDGRMVTYERRG